MENNRGILRRAVISGTVSGLATAGVASFAGKHENGSYAAPLNATSHIIWGEEAAYHDRPSLKYTLTGFLLNHASTIFWASFYEKLFGRHGVRQRMQRLPFTVSPGPVFLVKPLCRGATVATAAYIIDYHLIPKRFTPGFEKRVSGKSLTAIFAALAVGLAARDMIDAGVEFHKRR